MFSHNYAKQITIHLLQKQNITQPTKHGKQTKNIKRRLKY